MTLGLHAFTVTARDGAGNQTTKTVHYRVAEPNDRLTLASRRDGGAAGEGGNGGSELGVLSADGRYLVFESRATDLVPGFADGNGGRAAARGNGCGCATCRAKPDRDRRSEAGRGRSAPGREQPANYRRQPAGH